MKNIFQELFQIWNPFHNYGFMITSVDHFSIYATKRERKLLTSIKQNENLNKVTHKFSNVQNHKKSYSKTTFRIILLFR